MKRLTDHLHDRAVRMVRYQGIEKNICRRLSEAERTSLDSLSLAQISIVITMTSPTLEEIAERGQRFAAALELL